MKKLYLTLILIISTYQMVLSETPIDINNKINIFQPNYEYNNDNFLLFNNIETNFIDNYNNQIESLDNFQYFTENFASKGVNEESESMNQLSPVIHKDSSGYVPWAEFFYADQQRFTFNGDLALTESKIKPLNTALIFGTYSVIFYVQHKMQQNTIWKNVGTFNFQEDIQYSLWVDKFGHFYGGYSTSYLLSEMLQLSGFSWETSTILGSALGLSYMTYIEVLDGLSVGWGFSPSDFYADVAGSAFYVAQYYFPFLQNFSPKFEYVNPKWLGEKDRLPHDTFIDNYSCQTFWLSINIRNLFGGKVREYTPKWLNLAVGYAAYSLSGWDWQNQKYYYPSNISHPVNPDAAGNRKLIIALDYDLVKMLPDGPPFWNWMKQSLNLFKLPSPAVEFGFEGKTKIYLLYPFQFNLAGIRL